jgi:DNA-3-methyladenine glycosylase II
MSTPTFAAARRHLSRRDPVLKAVIARVGPCTLAPISDDPLTILVRCVVFQQLSTAAGRTIFSRLSDKVGGMPFRPQKLAKLSDAELRSCGLSGAKARTVAGLVEFATADPVRLANLLTASDDDVRATVTTVKGIGPWSADMFLMFGLIRPDVFPTGDLGIRTAVRNLYGFADLPTVAEMQEVAAKWSPHRTVASWYLWRSLDPVTDDIG